ncbi:MAG: hypothetical protein AAGH19_04195 [Pseudomonadota bacterium]
MKGQQILMTLLCAMLALGAGPVVAEEPMAEEQKVTTREMVDSKLADMKDRLALDEYQWTQVEMILKSSIRERVAIIRRYGLDGDEVRLANLEGSEKRAMRRELKDCRKNAEKRMKRYLDKEQYQEFKTIQEEIHEELLARIEAI